MYEKRQSITHKPVIDEEYLNMVVKNPKEEEEKYDLNFQEINSSQVIEPKNDGVLQAYTPELLSNLMEIMSFNIKMCCQGQTSK